MRWMIGLMMALWLVLAPSALAQEMSAADEELILREGPPVIPADWQVVEGPWLRVYGAERTMPTMLRLADEGSELVEPLAAALGVPVGGTIHVVLAPTRHDFLSLQPGRVPEYADGTAWPSRGHIYLQRPGIRGSDRPLDQVLRHEIVHILLGRAFAPQHPPTWLQEGTATVLSGELDGEMSSLLVQSVAAGHDPSLDALAAGFPSDPSRASLAYAASADFIAYLQSEYGEQVLPELVRASAAGAPLPAAVHEVTGEFLYDLEPAWKRRFHRASLSWMAALSRWEMWWAIGGGFAMVGLVLARRRSNARLREMAEEEARLDALMARLFADQDEPEEVWH